MVPAERFVLEQLDTQLAAMGATVRKQRVLRTWDDGHGHLVVRVRLWTDMPYNPNYTLDVVVENAPWYLGDVTPRS